MQPKVVAKLLPHLLQLTLNLLKLAATLQQLSSSIEIKMRNNHWKLHLITDLS